MLVPGRVTLAPSARALWAQGLRSRAPSCHPGLGHPGLALSSWTASVRLLRRTRLWADVGAFPVTGAVGTLVRLPGGTV